MKHLNVLIAAGGTGGHLFPAVAVLEALQRKILDFDLRIFAVGNPEKIEAKTAIKYGWKFFQIPMIGFTGFGFKTISFFLRTIKSVHICRDIVREHNIDLVISTGAYVSYPVGIAAKAEKKPLFLIETNVYPGRANRLLSRRADLIFLAFEETKKWLNPNVLQRTLVVGNPVRNGLLGALPKDESKNKLGFSTDRPVLLVFGGSLGAMSINNAVFEIYEQLLTEGIQIIWQTGKHFNKPILRKEGVMVSEFIEDMATAYSAADLVVSRAGASTIAELAALGKPAILVPLPKAANNHQELNAIELERSRSAIMIKDSEIKDKLLPAIRELIFSKNKLLEFAQNIRRYGDSNSAEKIAQGILKFLSI